MKERVNLFEFAEEIADFLGPDFAGRVEVNVSEAKADGFVRVGVSVIPASRSERPQSKG